MAGRSQTQRTGRAAEHFRYPLRVLRADRPHMHQRCSGVGDQRPQTLLD
ncbi:hypothetical protein ACFYPC_13740 [Streptomyces sp. NPDC005808]